MIRLNKFANLERSVFRGSPLKVNKMVCLPRHTLPFCRHFGSVSETDLLTLSKDL